MQSENSGQQTSSNGVQNIRKTKDLNCNTLIARKQLFDWFQLAVCFVMTLKGSGGTRQESFAENFAHPWYEFCYSESSCNYRLIYILLGKTTHLKFGGGLNFVCLVLIKSSEHFVGS